MVINRISGEPETDKLIRKYWKPGHVNYTTLYDAGGYAALAEYIVKPAPEELKGQLSMFDDEERKQLVKYSTSRNLIRPVAEHKEYKRHTVRKLLTEGPEPEPGYYIDKDSVYQGINPYTGMSYLFYREKCASEAGTDRRWTHEDRKHLYRFHHPGTKTQKRIHSICT